MNAVAMEGMIATMPSARKVARWKGHSYEDRLAIGLASGNRR